MVRIPMSGRRPRLVIFAKAPHIGRAKTRLAADIGPVEAQRFYRDQVAKTVRRLAADAPWQTILAVTPDHTIDPIRRLFPDVTGLALIPQGRGNLGARMQSVFDRLPPGPVIIVGTDCPELKASHVAQAFKELGNQPVVFGPAADGGYYLIGQRRSPAVLRLFEGVRWSSAYTLDDTLANMPFGTRAARLETLADVDTGADYKAYLRRVG
ncbi:MAG: TIGR04282 family arsenosugar biosynthesis glycosyltransferase [Pseudomonadota bacterium]